ncbi:MAG: hypothetical protein AVDCRST_MAG56-2077 [uncultured Cytophagales bacterium]|uniref:Uncharacterized protein n=1 Tax=uncultured Cytophagales bacterium TaxID=158755 RepID=A0A6J4IKK3_9SPHI|nr:MAG: hypothetical protein AVDCRST_MAG56-2077 [uncultured Cytophagales bacterium]
MNRLLCVCASITYGLAIGTALAAVPAVSQKRPSGPVSWPGGPKEKLLPGRSTSRFTL